MVSRSAGDCIATLLRCVIGMQEKTVDVEGLRIVSGVLDFGNVVFLIFRKSTGISITLKSLWADVPWKQSG